MDGNGILAPTPIVRITAEQLEYLIGRIRGTDDVADRKRWRAKPFLIPVPALPTAVPLLNVNKARVGFWISSPQAASYIAPTGLSSPGQGIQVSSASSLSLWIGRDTLGWQITQGWDAFNGTVPTTFVGLEVQTSSNWAD